MAKRLSVLPRRFVRLSHTRQRALAALVGAAAVSLVINIALGHLWNALATIVVAAVWVVILFRRTRG